MVTGVNNNSTVYTPGSQPSDDSTKVDPGKPQVPGGNFQVGNGTPPPKTDNTNQNSTGNGGVPPPTTDGKPNIQALIVSWTTSSSLPIISDNMSLVQLREAMSALMLKNRSDNFKTRDQELQASVQQKLAGVKKGLEAAEKQRDAAVTAAIFQVAGAVVQIGLSTIAIRSSISTLRGANTPTLDAGANTMSRWQAFQRTDPMTLSALGQAVSTAFNLPGTWISENMKVDAANLTAEQQKYDIAGEKASSISQQAGERAANELQAFQTFLQGLLQAEQLAADAAKRTFG